jgi:hypothetical protein
MPGRKKQFFFVHIPKTAGTTFVLTLARHFKWKKKISFYSAQGRTRFLELDPRIKDQYELCIGHLPFLAEQKLERGIDHFTFLRKPRERFISGYRYLKNDHVQHAIKKLVDIKQVTLKEIIKKGLSKSLDNQMVRFLSGNMNKGFMEINEEDAKLAIHNLDTYFPVFGLTEYFDESLVLLSDHMKWEPLYYVRENTSGWKMDPSELDEETEALIARCNRYDDMLYDHARKRFESMLEEKKLIVEKGLKELRSGNENRKLSISLRNKAALFYNRLRQRFVK